MMTGSRRAIEIVNAMGLHLRAAQRFARLAQQYRAKVWVHRRDRIADGKSILDLMTLAAECGARLDLEARGADAEEVLAALVALVAQSFADGETAQHGTQIG
jgi:phosphocarrier protein